MLKQFYRLKPLLWLPVAVFVNNHIVSVTFIEGRSMQPALNPDTNRLRKDFVLLNKFVSGSFSKTHLKKGDVVTLYNPQEPEELITKRIIAMPGDSVFPNTNSRFFKYAPINIPEGHCWIEGDEGFHSFDSNSFGYVPLGLIQSKVSFVLYPFYRFGFVQSKIPNWKISRIS
ncbi:hypothetical protein BB561_004264 [Smittium simulii]|uniref:Mitochondrial inner membrane protease subunit 2 n=1 Tax=Smittium simulii TaxID=133385 RepID=A0A2T9YH55_9FUNG|nr:hypothetical protein BB561_004264 [Smittium simulii]